MKRPDQGVWQITYVQSHLNGSKGYEPPSPFLDLPSIVLRLGQNSTESHGQSAAADIDVGAQTPNNRYRTPRSSASGLRKGIFELPELLETIISLLSEREILANAQRVSRVWKDTIARSPKLQRKLWLRSQAANVAAPIGHSGDSQLLLPTGDPRFERRVIRDPNVPIYANDVAPNRLLQTFGDGPGFWHIPAEVESLVVIKHMVGAPFDGFMLHTYTLDLPLNLMSQSWHGMYLTERRITTAQLKVCSIALHQLMDNQTPVDSWTTASMREVDGLTFGSVMVVAKKICHTVCTCKCSWRLSGLG